ncbi:hypothetical protein [Bacillus coreaensis]
MIMRIFLLLTGFGLAVLGGISTVAYLNLLTTGYTIMDYLEFIKGRIECYLFLVGMLMIWLSIYFPGKEE